MSGLKPTSYHTHLRAVLYNTAAMVDITSAALVSSALLAAAGSKGNKESRDHSQTATCTGGGIGGSLQLLQTLCTSVTCLVH